MAAAAGEGQEGFATFTADGVVVMGGGGAVEVRVMPGIGGGRGVFACRDIRVGEVVLQEAPLVRALPTNQKSEEGTVRAKDEPLHMQLTRRVLQDPRRDALLEQMAVLYPRSVVDMDADVYKRAKRHHADSVDKLVDQQRQAPSAPQPLMAEEDVLIVLLKVCFNAFQGGVYVKKGMFNHSCRPNCETFAAGERPGRNAGAPAASSGASEIVANTDIPAGTELTISYLFPIEQTHASRRRKFEKQHFCDIGPSPWPREMEALLWEDEKEFDDEVRKEVLDALAQVEEALDHLDDLLESGEATHKFAFKQLKSELAEAETLVPPNHLVICRINNMMVRSANEMVRSQKKPSAALMASILRSSLQVLDAVHGGVTGHGSAADNAARGGTTRAADVPARSTAAVAAHGAAAPGASAAGGVSAAAPDPWDIFGGDDTPAPQPHTPPAVQAPVASAAAPPRASGMGALPVSKPGYAAYNGGTAAGGAGGGLGGGGGFKLPGALGGSAAQGAAGGGAGAQRETWTGAAVLGLQHCERARVLCDVHVSLDFLIQHAPDLLYSSFGDSLSSWQKASKMEYAAKKEFRRIAALYGEQG